MAADHTPPGLRVFNVLRGEASEVRSVPFGDVGTLYSGPGIEMVWVSKLAEPIDANWFSSLAVDLILVVQGQLKFEFESPDQADRVLGVGDVLVLPPGMRCRAYRWPRDASEATVFVAAYPAAKQPAPVSPPDQRDGPLLPTRSQDDTDVGWGEPPAPDDDERLNRERPPHWGSG